MRSFVHSFKDKDKDNKDNKDNNILGNHSKLETLEQIKNHTSIKMHTIGSNDGY